MPGVRSRVRTAILCRHCKERRVNTWYELCTVCYAIPTIRALYKKAKVTSPVCEVRPIEGDSRKPATATTAPPGTEEKLVEMEKRAAMGCSVFHPQDGTF